MLLEICFPYSQSCSSRDLTFWDSQYMERSLFCGLACFHASFVSMLCSGIADTGMSQKHRAMSFEIRLCTIYHPPHLFFGLLQRVKWSEEEVLVIVILSSSPLKLRSSSYMLNSGPSS